MSSCGKIPNIGFLSYYRVCFCFSLARELWLVKEARSHPQPQSTVNTATDKEADVSGAQELGERGETKTENI